MSPQSKASPGHEPLKQSCNDEIEGYKQCSVASKLPLLQLLNITRAEHHSTRHILQGFDSFHIQYVGISNQRRYLKAMFCTEKKASFKYKTISKATAVKKK